MATLAFNALTSIPPEIRKSRGNISGGIEVDQFAQIRFLLEGKFEDDPVEYWGRSD